MKTAEEWFREASPVFGKEAQLKLIRRIQADALAHAASIWIERDEALEDGENAMRKRISAEAEKLEL